MLLNSRQNGFVFSFPPDFFSDAVKEKYKKYYQSLILPYDSINDFMSSTIQSVDFPGWNMDPAVQTRLFGKKQDFKNAIQIPDLFSREFTITFKLTDAYLNYFIFLENSLNFLDFEKSKTLPTFPPMRLSLLDNQGYLVASIIFNRPILKGQDGFKLSYSAGTPDFKTFNAKFSYFDFDIELDFNRV
jgi:hypothetical protein